MKTREIALPASTEERTKVLRSCEVKCNIYSVFFFIFLAIAVVGLIGALVSVLVYELNSNVSDALGAILIGSFFGGGIDEPGTQSQNDRPLIDHGSPFFKAGAVKIDQILGKGISAVTQIVLMEKGQEIFFVMLLDVSAFLRTGHFPHQRHGVDEPAVAGT